MTRENFSNDAQTTLTTAVTTAVQTTIDVDDASEFPDAPQFRIKILNEILLVTALNTATNWTVTRGVEGTTASTYSIGAEISHVFTAGGLSRGVRGDLSYADDTGSADSYAVSLSPAATEYSEGMVVRFKAANNNTGASTLNVDGLGDQGIKRNATEDLEAGDIIQDRIETAIYDGTNFQHISVKKSIENENLSGQADGTATVFTTVNPYIASSIKVYHNGLRALRITDYTETDSTSITFTDIPYNGDTIVVDYRTT